MFIIGVFDHWVEEVLRQESASVDIMAEDITEEDELGFQ